MVNIRPDSSNLRSEAQWLLLGSDRTYRQNTPGLGVKFITDEAKKYLRDEDKDFFDN